MDSIIITCIFVIFVLDEIHYSKMWVVVVMLVI